jgi:DNA-binding protein HU-beta
MKGLSMADVNEKELSKLLARRMNTDEATARAWMDSVFEEMYEQFSERRGVSIRNFGRFYLKSGGSTWIFKFSPAQRLKALFGWSNTYRG